MRYANLNRLRIPPRGVYVAASAGCKCAAVNRFRDGNSTELDQTLGELGRSNWASCFHETEALSQDPVRHRGLAGDSIAPRRENPVPLILLEPLLGLYKAVPRRAPWAAAQP